jgi:hypothetical protein
MTQAKIEPEPPKNIYQLISLISAEAGALEPTTKQGVPFPFRGVDGVVNHLSPILRKHGVITVPEVLSAIVTPREVGQRVVKTTEVVTRFHFYAPDGTSVSATTAGLADDFADRSTAQAQSVAYRIALLQTFTLPTQSPEPEQTGQDVMENKGAKEAPRAVQNAQNGATTAQKTQADPKVEEWQTTVREAWESAHGVGDIGYVQLGNKLNDTKDFKVWSSSIPKLQKLKEAIEAGEVA